MPRIRKGSKIMDAKAENPKSDWQFSLSVTECNRHMLENRVATDVTFLVSDENAESETETFCAHKYMLISRSPVFYTMLCGALAERGKIRVTDVDPDAFGQMLNYIYTDDVNLTLHYVLDVINVSKKYLLPRLTAKCAEFIEQRLNIENVCTILDQILIFEENDLNDICLDLIMRETNKVLETEGFFSIRRDTLSKILGIKRCSIKEVDVFKACVQWARQKCVEDENKVTNDNIRMALGDCITQFRFSDVGEFARDVCPIGVFTKDEEHGMLLHLADREVIPAPAGFNGEARLRPIHRVVTTKKIHQIECDKLEFNITVISSIWNKIKVNSILIGKAPPFYGYSVKYNGTYVHCNFIGAEDPQKVELRCISPLIINHDSFSLQIIYKSKNIRTDTDVEIYGVARRDITLKDSNRMQLKLSSTFFMPILGLSYQIMS